MNTPRTPLHINYDIRIVLGHIAAYEAALNTFADHDLSRYPAARGLYAALTKEQDVLHELLIESASVDG